MRQLDHKKPTPHQVPFRFVDWTDELCGRREIKIKIKSKIKSKTLAFAAALLITVLCAQDLRAAETSGAVGAQDLTPEVELAIEKGLEYLAKTQKPDGSWGDRHKTANAALALMAFMVRGDMPDEPPYGEAMSKALDYILKESEAGRRGFMGKSMYEHGFATLALSEVCGMNNQGKRIRKALKRGVDVIIRSQGHNGAWTYNPAPSPSFGDISVTGAQLVALASAKEAGMFVPNETIDRAMTFINSCYHKPVGSFGYKGPGVGYARTGLGVTSLMLCGQRDHPNAQAGLKWLQENADYKEPHGWQLYSRYYGGIALFQAGDEPFNAFYDSVRDWILKT